MIAYVPEDTIHVSFTKEEAQYLNIVLEKVEAGPLKRIYNKVHSALEKEKEKKEEMIA